MAYVHPNYNDMRSRYMTARYIRSSTLQTLRRLTSGIIAAAFLLGAAQYGMATARVSGSAGETLDVQYHKFARHKRDEPIRVSVKRPKGLPVQLTLGSGFTSKFELAGVSPPPVSSTKKNDELLLTFNSARDDDLAITILARPLALGRASASIRSTVGQEISASLTVDQIVIP